MRKQNFTVKNHQVNESTSMHRRQVKPIKRELFGSLF